MLYKNPVAMVEEAIVTFLEDNCERELILVDHSPDDRLKNLIRNRVKYIHNPQNPGYGFGHNLAFQLADNPECFFIINPDVVIQGGTILILQNTLVNNPNIGLITCNVFNPDGSIQKLLKNDPTVSAFLARRMKGLEKISKFKNSLKNFMMADEFYQRDCEIPIASGCFIGIRGEVFDKIRGFDERYFLYFEDFDLCRKVRAMGLKVYYTPRASIIHYWNRGAHKSLRHLWYFSKSLVQYFSKWGWEW